MEIKFFFVVFGFFRRILQCFSPFGFLKSNSPGVFLNNFSSFWWIEGWLLSFCQENQWIFGASPRSSENSTVFQTFSICWRNKSSKNSHRPWPIAHNLCASVFCTHFPYSIGNTAVTYPFSLLDRQYSGYPPIFLTRFGRAVDWMTILLSNVSRLSGHIGCCCFGHIELQI